MKYYGGCDSGSTYTKCVILDETGKMVADVTLRSRINSVLSAQAALDEAVAQVPDLKSAKDLAYLVGTGYGRNKVPFADENIFRDQLSRDGRACGRSKCPFDH